MWRSILGIVAGILVGGIVVGVLEIPGMLMHPLPPGTDTSDWDAIKAHAAKAPTAAHVGLGIAWTVGPLVGAWLAAFIARRAFLAHAAIVGTFFLAMNVLNIRSLPHHGWLVGVGLLAPVVSSWLGAAIAARMASPPTARPQPYDMRERNMAC
jgi:hypothetical protein